MSSILMSIKPKFVAEIFSGKKKYEFRKRVCKKKVDKIIIYSTFPVCKVVGEAEINNVLIDSPNRVWSITKNYAGIEKKFFDNYFANKDVATAYELTNVKKYPEPKELSEFGVRVAPQSYQYVD